MGKIQKHIQIVRSDIAGLSSLSRVSATAIQEVLARHYSQVQISHINSHAQLAALKDLSPDLVFLGMKFLPQSVYLGKTDLNKIWIADYLDDHAIRYTGSPGKAAQFDQDKSLAKRCIQRSGLNTSRFFITNPESLPSAAAMPFAYPVFIKPPKMGGGQGVDKHSVAHTYIDFCTKVSSIAEQHGAESLVEEYLTGREFSVAMLVSEQTGEVHAMPIELVSQKNERGDRMLSSEVKTANSETASAVDDSTVRSEVCQLAIEAFVALGGRDYGRIDIRLNSAGKPQFLEANLIPSIIDGYGSFPKACQLNADLGYEDMILQIVRLGFAHDTKELQAPIITDENAPQLKSSFSATAFSLS
jgi:D-alanine-D-alanine ligase